MKVVVNPYRIDVELTERNLRTLLLKLERDDSARTLEIYDEGGNWLVAVKSVPDEEHYTDREPGEVHEIEEAKLGPAVDDIAYIDDDGDAVYDDAML